MGGDHNRGGTTAVASLPADIQRVAADYRRQLADLEAAYTRAVGPQRALMRERLRDAVGRFLRETRNAGLPDRVTRRWVSDLAAYRQLLTLAESELDRVTTEAVRAMQWQIAQAAELGKPAVDALAIATLQASDTEAALLRASFGQVPSGAVRELVGQLQDSSPLASLPRLNADAVQTMGRELTRGLVSGTNSRVIAQRIAATSDIPLQRAQTISRTETHRAYRESSRLAMQANPLVQEWVWNAEISARTCSACFSMHGTIHDTDEVMGSHPNCRCAMLPRVTPPTWMTDAPDVEYPTGETIFSELSADAQREILGPGKYQAYSEGRITLADTVRVRESQEWGVTRSTASLSEALGARV
jgi:SPP1 gp7 family putative phage head morphogenesis protein